MLLASQMISPPRDTEQRGANTNSDDQHGIVQQSRAVCVEILLRAASAAVAPFDSSSGSRLENVV